MDQNENFFSKNHTRLLDIANWSKYLAWIILIGFLLYATGSFIQNMQYRHIYTGYPSNTTSTFLGNSLLTVNALLESITEAFKGVALFLVLKGISLGLNMIVETDINYRDGSLKEDRGAQ